MDSNTTHNEANHDVAGTPRRIYEGGDDVCMSTDEPSGAQSAVADALGRVRDHSFHPVEDGFTADRTLGEAGIADLEDPDWRVRLLAVRDLVRSGAPAAVAGGLADDDPQVRYAAATALGILAADGPVDDLEGVLRDDPVSIVRSQAAVALGQVGAERSLASLEDRRENDPSRDVRHQAELAVDRVRKGATAGEELRAAYRDLDPSTFGRVRAGDRAPGFALPDTDGRTWELGDLADEGEWTVLLWVFADWCPVCHTEFDELIEGRDAFEAAGVSVATVECHDEYRARVMVGEEVDPEYWFADESFRERYTDRVWWPHLVDRAGAVGATYGVDPMAYAVHAEYVNRPATVVVDPAGAVRLAYFGTFWGDRPSVEETLAMVRTEQFEYEHPDRLDAA